VITNSIALKIYSAITQKIACSSCLFFNRKEEQASRFYLALTIAKSLV